MPCRLFPGELDGRPCLCAVFELHKRQLTRLHKLVARVETSLLGIRREPLASGYRVTLFLLPQTQIDWEGV